MTVFQWIAIISSAIYLFFLFSLAFFVERSKKMSYIVKNNSTIYALSLCIYCSAWTFYGSIGMASQQGIQFLPIYLGPTLIMPLWFIVTKKAARITKIQNFTTFADFISARYSNSINLGMFITLLSIIGIVPYISLQIKAIYESFMLLIQTEHLSSSNTTTFIPFLIVLIMGVFINIFASKKMDSNEHHTGIVASIAFESLFKLIAFFIAGSVICLIIFKNPTQIYEQIIQENLNSHLLTFGNQNHFFEWAGLIVLSGIAIFLLPRQFQVSVIENVDESHIKKAIWKLPLYLFLINLFVLPIALGGNVLLNGKGFNPDYYILELPLAYGLNYISLLVFLGGFSAAAAMIVLETVALSNMLSNNFLIPLILKLGKNSKNISGILASKTLFLRHISVFIILFLTLLYFHSINPKFSLVSIGLISFVFIAQFFPSYIGSLYLKESNSKAVFLSLTTGFLIWFFTLILPTLASESHFFQSILNEGLFGISLLRPENFLGISSLSVIMNSFFWSLFFNVLVYVFCCLYFEPSQYEKKQAYLYVDVYKYGTLEESQIIWSETAALSDIEILLVKFLGKEKTKIALNSFSKRYQVDNESNLSEDPRLIPFVERLLSKIVGTVSARILLESVIKEKEININEMLDIIQESKEVLALNRELFKKSNELEKAKKELEKTNNQLLLYAEMKDDFLATVSHELKSPLTAICSFSEILKDSEHLTEEEVIHFSEIINKESQRITRLVNQLLDLEKYDTGKEPLNLSIVHVKELFEDVENALKGELNHFQSKLIMNISKEIHEIVIDKDKMMQVLINLLTNALKFSNKNSEIKITCFKVDKIIHFEIEDQGKGIDEEYWDLIFEKFFQARNQTLKKPKGSGLGLAICRKIIRLHQGNIYVKNSTPNGTIFKIELPTNINL